MYDIPPEGLQIAVKEGSPTPTGAHTVIEALKKANIEFRAFQKPGIREGDIELQIGRKSTHHSN
jgi:hypothetical protein